jgi:hypothetical protein
MEYITRFFTNPITPSTSNDFLSSISHLKNVKKQSSPLTNDEGIICPKPRYVLKQPTAITIDPDTALMEKESVQLETFSKMERMSTPRLVRSESFHEDVLSEKHPRLAASRSLTDLVQCGGGPYSDNLPYKRRRAITALEGAR